MTVPKSKMRILHSLNNIRATQAIFLFCSLLHLIFAEGELAEPQPGFLGPLENHTNIRQGRDVTFTCIANNLGNHKVAWIKVDTKAILSIQTNMVAQNPRLSVTHNGNSTWKLHISNVQLNDSGTYMCQIDTEPMQSVLGYLQVVIPPNILVDNESSEDSGVVIEGDTFSLECLATGVPEPTFVWKREDGQNIKLHQEGGQKKEVQVLEGATLVLRNVQRTDMGVYLCIADNGVRPPDSKRFIVRIQFSPMVRVSNKLVSASIGQDVFVECYVETYPKAINQWMQDNGEKIVPNDKYATEETSVNDYTLVMKLTIRNITKTDFGKYVCMSSNNLGKAEGVIRLQELQPLQPH